jgi:two-component system cell cycle response regulator
MWFSPLRVSGFRSSDFRPIEDVVPTPVTKILLIEDNPGDARLLREALAEIANSRFEVTHRKTLGLALNSLAKSKPDVILSDLGLPDSQGLDTVRQLHDAAPQTPLVVLTALNDESFGSQALQEGAQDYLVKGQIDGGLLWHALRYAMERQRVQLQMLSLSLIDDLTGLNNRRGFFALAEYQVKVARRTGKSFLLAFIDLDGMKQINDTFGHQEGNRALVDAARVLKDAFRQSDVLARIGGDEFAILIADADGSSIETVGQRVQQKVLSCNADPGRQYDLSFSIGIIPDDATQQSGLEQLLSQADALMYQQKRGKGASRKAAKSSR